MTQNIQPAWPGTGGKTGVLILVFWPPWRSFHSQEDSSHEEAGLTLSHVPTTYLGGGGEAGSAPNLEQEKAASHLGFGPQSYMVLVEPFMSLDLGFLTCKRDSQDRWSPDQPEGGCSAENTLPQTGGLHLPGAPGEAWGGENGSVG